MMVWSLQQQVISAAQSVFFIQSLLTGADISANLSSFTNITSKYKQIKL